jgi:hypothetical protein
MAVESFIIFPFGSVVIKIPKLPISSFMPTIDFLFFSYIFLSICGLVSSIAPSWRFILIKNVFFIALSHFKKCVMHYYGDLYFYLIVNFAHFLGVFIITLKSILIERNV